MRFMTHLPLPTTHRTKNREATTTRLLDEQYLLKDRITLANLASRPPPPAPGGRRRREQGMARERFFVFLLDKIGSGLSWRGAPKKGSPFKPV